MAVNARIMTLFLWHLTALVIAAVVLVMAFGLPTPAAATGWWWLSKPLWIATAGAVLAVLVAVFGRAEDPRPVGASRTPVDGSSTLDMAATCVGLVLVVRGLIGLALDGFSRVLDAAGRDFAWLSLSPVADVVLILLGYALVEGLWHRRRHTPADAEVHPPPPPEAETHGNRAHLPPERRVRAAAAGEQLRREDPRLAGERTTGRSG